MRSHIALVLRVAAAAVFACTPALAQLSLPDHSVAIGRGPGASGFKNATPGPSGGVLRSTGPSADPSFQPSTSVVEASDYGVVGINGNVQTQLQNAVAGMAALNTPHGGGKLTLPCGPMRINGTISIANGGEIEGCGSNYTDYGGPNVNATIIYQDHATADAISVTTQQPFRLKNVRIEMNSGTGRAIYIAGATGTPPNAGKFNNMSEIHNVVTVGGSYGLYMVASRFYQIDHNVFTAATIANVYLGSTSNDGDLGDASFTANKVLGTVGGSCTNMILDTQALPITHNKFFGCSVGINLRVSKSSGTLQICQNSIENFGIYGIHFQQTVAGKEFDNIDICHNQFLVSVGVTTSSAIFADTGTEPCYLRGTSVTENKIRLDAGAPTNFVVNIAGGCEWTIANNNIGGNGAGSTGLIVGGNTSRAQANDNMFATATIGILYNVGAQTRVRDMVNDLVLANLGPWGNGSQVYATDATPGTCAGLGAGAVMFRLNAGWRCP